MTSLTDWLVIITVAIMFTVLGYWMARENTKTDRLLLDHENRNLRADLTLAQLRASALEARIERMKGGTHE